MSPVALDAHGFSRMPAPDGSALLLSVGHQRDGHPALLLVGSAAVVERARADCLHARELHAVVREEATDGLDTALGERVVVVLGALGVGEAAECSGTSQCDAQV